MNFESHPNKPLEKHICGVMEKSCKFSSACAITQCAALFHDLGKINPNFQKKLRNISTKAYSNHSYLSVLAFFNFAKNNLEQTRALLAAINDDDLKIKRLQTIALIACHHGDLPDFERMPNMEEITMAADFAKDEQMPFSEFLQTNLQREHNSFLIEYSEKAFAVKGKYIQHLHEKIWQTDALNYFMNTQFAFAALIQADKRDAGNNDIFLFEESIKESVQTIETELSKKINVFDSTKNPTDLNRLRTEIRLEATKNVAKMLANNQRVFTLTAPTGAGKTFTLLSVAREIQKQKGDLGILYALPFLSITEQVQTILQNDLNIDFLPISSKAQNENVEFTLRQYENNPTEENLQKLLQQDFAEQTFDHPFVVTTFVQLFETLISDKNSTLLKLPNFTNRIFLIDEVQALPPRLYIFFSAWLDAFCKKHNSYVVLSTATMPKLDFPNKKLDFVKDPKSLFTAYQPPEDLLDAPKYFSENIFNRYIIKWIRNDNFLIQDLSEHILQQEKSCLVILNTIADTKLLYENIREKENVILLNTHFIPEDRIAKIEQAKTFLKSGEKITLISTQLIEAGVDIDFPVVYRDLCPLPSLIQSAGRCNRNKTIDLGEVFFFQLKKEEGRPSSEIIYKKEAAEFLKFCKENIVNDIKENQLFDIQSKFFDYIKNNLTIGQFDIGDNSNNNMVECVNRAEFEHLGKFQLINNDFFGQEFRYYIPENESDNKLEELYMIISQSFNAKNYEEKKKLKIKLDNGLKRLSNRILNVRIKKNQNAPLFREGKEFFGIRILSDLDKYSSKTGLNLGNENLFL